MAGRNPLAAIPFWVAPAMAIAGVAFLVLAAGLLWASGGGDSSTTPIATPTSRAADTATPEPTTTPEDPPGAVPAIIGDLNV